MNTEHTYDFVDTSGRINPKSSKEEVVILSVDSHKKLLEEIKELRVTVSTYKVAIQKLIIEKDLLLEILKK